MSEKRSGKVTFEYEGDILAEFDFADVETGECVIDYIPGAEELVAMVLDGCIQHIESIDENDNDDNAGMIH